MVFCVFGLKELRKEIDAGLKHKQLKVLITHRYIVLRDCAIIIRRGGGGAEKLEGGITYNCCQDREGSK